MKIKKAQECRWGMVGLGALVQRFSPGHTPLHSAYSFERSLSGAEFNLVAANAMWNIPCAFFTANLGHFHGTTARHPLGEWIDREARRAGVELVSKNMDVDPINGPIMAHVFTDCGWGPRAPKTYYIRNGEAATLLKSGDFNWEELFSEGIRWAHSGGFFAALNTNTSNLVLEYITEAKKSGAITSLDLNWRKMLWASLQDIDQHRSNMRNIVSQLDVCVGNEEDWQETFGITYPKNMGCSKLDPNNYEILLRNVKKQFPNLKLIATTLRQVVSANRHHWQGVMLYGEDFLVSPVLEDLHVMDRVGGGDGFAAALFHGLLLGYDPQDCLNYGWAHGALLTTYPTDTTLATWEDVKNLAAGGNARILR